MAKGDDKRVQNSIDSQYGSAAQRAENIQRETGDRTNQMFEPAYRTAMPMNLNNYDDVMNNYRQFLGLQPSSGQSSGGQRQGSGTSEQLQQLVGGDYSREHLVQILPQLKAMGIEVQNQERGDLRPRFTLPNGETWDMGDQGWVNRGNMSGSNSSSGGGQSQFMGDYGALGPALAGYGEFAQTGGFSPQDIQDIRARAISPIRSMYSTAQDELSRAKNLSGGYMPNYGAASAKMTRDLSHRVADINTDVGASIAQMRNQGRQFGIAGQGNIGLTGRNQALQGMSGMGSLYGTTPGLTDMFGRQVLASNGQGIDLAGLQAQIANQRVNAQLGRGQLKDNWDRFGQASKAASDVASIGGYL